MIKRIEIQGLFDRFNYILNLNRKINIITAPNGFGKTTILRIIRDILEDKLFDLSKIVLKTITLVNDSDFLLKIEKSNSDLIINGETVIVPNSIKKVSENRFRLEYKGDGENQYRGDLYVNLNEDMVSVDLGDELLNILFEDTLILGDVKLKGGINNTKYVKDLALFYSGVGNAYFLESDRLFDKSFFNKTYTRFRGEIIETESINIDYIDTIPAKIIEKMNEFTNRYAIKSAVFDSEFLSKLSAEIKKEQNPSYKKEDYNLAFSRITEKMEVLNKYGLLKDSDSSRIKKGAFDENYSLVFKIFAQDYQRKIAIFQPLIDKLILFEQLVNQKLLYKKIVLDKTNGLSIILDNSNKSIAPKDLSSGEKEIVVMYFNLIFESNPMRSCSIYLVDEPEISLHVEWQHRIIDDLQKILSIDDNKKQIIICTHSPQVIGEHWKDVIELAKQNN